VVRGLSRTALAVVASLTVSACSGYDGPLPWGDPSGGNGGSSSAAPPGDAFFRAVIAGPSGLSGTANVILFNPAYASQRAPGSPGTQAGSMDAIIIIYTASGTVELTGTYTSTSIMVSGNGWSISATFTSSEITGTITQPSGATGTLTGLSLEAGSVGTFCGSFTGSDMGTWNLSVSESGSVEGSFYGALAGTGNLTGTSSGETITLTWSTTVAGSGTATGQIDSSTTTIQGTWTGTSVSGTWNSTSTCPGNGTAPTIGAASGCSCAALLSAAGGTACCPGGACCST
jgi:hypothetical protein